MTLPAKKPIQDNADISSEALDIIFLEARTHNGWKDEDVSDETLQHIYDLTKMAPTSANCQPLRVVFIRSKEAKERLKPLLDKGNQEKTMQAPVTAIFAYDPKFYNELPWLFPHMDAKSWFTGNEKKAEYTAIQNGNLQAAYFMLAARAMGVDCGPMGGFDHDGVDKEFLSEAGYKSLFICSLGHGDPSKLHPRSPRPDFTKFCKVI